MFDYAALEILATVAQERSFSRAGQQLLLTQSAVSQRIKALEETVSQPLIVRANPPRLTQAGQQLVNHYRQVSVLEGAVREKWQLGPHKREMFSLCIALNTESLSTWFIKAIQPFLHNYNCLVELLIEDQERTNLILSTGKAWGCVSSIGKSPFGCTSTALGEMIYRPVASRKFKQRYFNQGVTGKSLLEAPAAVYGEHDYMHGDYFKKHFRGYAKGRPNLHYVPSPEGLLNFTIESLGYALLPEASIKNALARGSLVDLAPQKPFRLPLFWQTQQLQTEITAELSKQIIKHAQAVLH